MCITDVSCRMTETPPFLRPRPPRCGPPAIHPDHGGRSAFGPRASICAAPCARRRCLFSSAVLAAFCAFPSFIRACLPSLNPKPIMSRPATACQPIFNRYQCRLLSAIIAYYRLLSPKREFFPGLRSTASKPEGCRFDWHILCRYSNFNQLIVFTHDFS
jgi:hypothetical protein